MNTPNKLTLLRVVLVPLFLVFLLIKSIPYNYIYALLIFSTASITDFLDGYLARKNNQVTTFGKFLDPLADKVLVISAMICFIELGLASSIPIIIIVAREFMVTSIRLVAVSSTGNVIAAASLGKLKTIVQLVSLIAILLALAVCQVAALPAFIDIPLISNWLMWVSALITVISGIQYLVVNRGLINTTK